MRKYVSRRQDVKMENVDEVLRNAFGAAELISRVCCAVLAVSISQCRYPMPYQSAFPMPITPS
jgi:hypothetical protein